MEASSTVVIKVKHGEMLRRFSAPIVNGQLNLSIDGLRKKILSLFNFAPDTELTLTYIDEDSDVVTLADDEDLSDAVKQGLNPLRITVKVNADKNGREYNHSSGSSTPMRSPPLPNLNIGISEIVKTLPEPLHETLTKLSADFVSTASSTAPGIAELCDYFSKVGLSYLGQLSEFQPDMQGVVPESSTAATKTKDPENVKVKSKKPVPEASQKSNEVKVQNVTAGSKEGSSFGFNAVAEARDSQNPDVSHPKSGTVSRTVGRKVDAKKIIENVDASAKSPGSSNFPGSFCVPSPMYECPFSGNVSAVPSLPASDAVPFRRSVSQNDSSGTIFHRGVRCDGCGAYPMSGPRFKSKVKVDYDLCSICFDEMGNSSDYIRMDRPVVYRHHYPFKVLHDSRGRDRAPTLPPVILRGAKGKQGAVKLDSRFIQDVNIIDGTVMAPSTPFTKIWRMRNNGTAVWPAKSQLVWIGGDKLSNALSVEVEIPPAGLLLDQELDVAVDFISPQLPGRYISYWRMASPSGQKFGQRVWVLIQVDASVIEPPREIVRNLNLNLPPPVSSSLTDPEIINVEPEPYVNNLQPDNSKGIMVNVEPEPFAKKTQKPDNSKRTVVNVEPEPFAKKTHQPDNSKRIVELVQPATDLQQQQQPNNEQELKFPINDNLLVGNGASAFLPASASHSSVSYPIIDLSDVPAPAAPPLAGAVDLRGKNQVEEKLLRELEEMGFRQIDLNKEILRKNEYDLEQAVDHLCGVAEWDPILDELQEMGFHDTEMNKQLLKKNNGSIKRVVMDLIAGEEF